MGNRKDMCMWARGGGGRRRRAHTYSSQHAQEPGREDLEQLEEENHNHNKLKNSILIEKLLLLFFKKCSGVSTIARD